MDEKLDIKVLRDSKGLNTLLINGFDVSQKCVSIDSYTNAGEDTRVVITFEPDSFKIENI